MPSATRATTFPYARVPLATLETLLSPVGRGIQRSYATRAHAAPTHSARWSMTVQCAPACQATSVLRCRAAVTSVIPTWTAAPARPAPTSSARRPVQPAHVHTLPTAKSGIIALSAPVRLATSAIHSSRVRPSAWCTKTVRTTSRCVRRRAA